MANIGLPKLDILFKGLGVSAIERGKRGITILVIKDDTNMTFTFAEYRSHADLTGTELAKYNADNQMYIKDALDGVPLKLIVARMNVTEGLLSTLLTEIRGKAPRNCWIGIADGTTADHEALATWIKAENANNKKCYKGIVYNASVPDNMAITNFGNPTVTFMDSRGKQAGDQGISYLLGFFAGLPLDMSGIGKILSKFSTVEEPADMETAINAGKLMLYSEDGKVKVMRAINSLVTTGQDITDDMKFILIVEQMHMTYTDIYDNWNNSFKGKYKNFMDNQLLLVSAINSYFEGLENNLIMDPNFDNKIAIDTEAQRLANIPKYGADVVNGWDDKKAMTMTVGTKVILTANVKYLNAFEDLTMKIYM